MITKEKIETAFLVVFLYSLFVWHTVMVAVLAYKFWS